MPTSTHGSYYLLAGFVAFLFPFLTGFLGLLPIDQSIVFEAAGRINVGEKPFDDFYIPYGLVPAIMQAIIFKIAGVSWFTYVLHASLVNGLFAVLLFDVLSIWLPRQRKAVILAGTLVSAWAFYPMMGTPFMDNHSFFFAFLAYWSVLAGILRRKYWLILICFPCLVLGFYSKPLPVIFWIIPIILECWINRRFLKDYLKWFGWSVVIGLAFLALPLMIFNAHYFYYYTFLLPYRIGQARVEVSNEPIAQIIFGHERYKIWACLLFLTLTFLLLRIKQVTGDSRLAFYRAGCILFVSVVGAALTKNTFYNLFSVAGVVFLLVIYSLEIMVWKWAWLRNMLRFGLVLACMIVAALITKMNLSRRANELKFHVTDLKEYSPELGFFPKSPGGDYTIGDLRELYQLMKKEQCLYIGDMMFLYSITGNRNPWPVVHLHNGTSYYDKDSVEFTDVKLKLVKNLVKYQATCIISDILFYGPEELVVFVNELKGNRRKSFGRFVVYGIDKEKLAWMVSNLNTNRAK